MRIISLRPGRGRSCSDPILAPQDGMSNSEGCWRGGGATQLPVRKQRLLLQLEVPKLPDWATNNLSTILRACALPSR